MSLVRLLLDDGEDGGGKGATADEHIVCNGIVCKGIGKRSSCSTPCGGKVASMERNTEGCGASNVAILDLGMLAPKTQPSGGQMHRCIFVVKLVCLISAKSNERSDPRMQI